MSNLKFTPLDFQSCGRLSYRVDIGDSSFENFLGTIDYVKERKEYIFNTAIDGSFTVDELSAINTFIRQLSNEQLDK